MISLKRIFVATDFSKYSEVALQYAAEFAKAFQAEVLLCHTIDYPDLLATLPPTSDSYFPPNLTQLQENHARVECERALAAAGITNAKVLIPRGSASVKICELAKSEMADMIILGTHGRGGLAHLFLGSVAERVVRMAPCPVLTVRQHEHDFVKP